MAKLVLEVERDGALVRLRCPAVGTFTCAVKPGRTVTEGQNAGTLLVLGRDFELLVPEGVSGVVTSSAPEQVHAPVGYGTVLYELAPLAAGAARPDAARAEQASDGGALLFRSPQTGRFWHRTAPGEPALAAAGDVIESGNAVGLIEVMKTFTLVAYHPSGGLPQRARVVRVLAADGAEVAERGPLLELEPA